MLLAVSTDMLIAGTHFFRTPTRRSSAQALAVNLSISPRWRRSALGHARDRAAQGRREVDRAFAQGSSGSRRVLKWSLSAGHDPGRSRLDHRHGRGAVELALKRDAALAGDDVWLSARPERLRSRSPT